MQFTSGRRPKDGGSECNFSSRGKATGNALRGPAPRLTLADQRYAPDLWSIAINSSAAFAEKRFVSRMSRSPLRRTLKWRFRMLLFGRGKRRAAWLDDHHRGIRFISICVESWSNSQK